MTSRAEGVSPLRSSRAQRSLIFLAAAAVTSTFFINLCAWIFGCGCQSLWAGAAKTCNIHVVGARHCPWCTYGSGIPYIAMLAAEAAVSFLPTNWYWPWRLAGAITAFPVIGTLAGFIYGLVTGYWK